MKRIVILIIVLAAALSASSVIAESRSLVLSDTQISDIKTNCTSIQSSLSRVHENDALARVRLGREYESIATQLMAPMNNRLASNKIDTTTFAQITADFNAELNHFRGAQGVYPDYERTLSDALNINCYDQPVEFFDTVMSARTKREAVAASTTQLDELMARYRAEVGTVQTKLLTPAPGVTQ